MRAPLIPAAALVATLLVGGSADALDLEKAPTAATMIPCPSKGPGFVRVPGSASCFRISGRVAAGAAMRTGTAVGHVGTAAPTVSGRLAIDSRTDSDLGEVRTYVQVGNGRR